MTSNSRNFVLPGSVSRRALLQAGLGAIAAGFGGSAFAQQAEWGERFDSAARVTRMSRTSVPLLSPQTVAATELAVQEYSEIVMRGGWPEVPGGQRLRLGTRAPQVALLRQRLMASGDLKPTAGVSDVFDSYVEGAVRRFQARHGLLPVGVVGDDTQKALNIPAEARLRQLETNIVRLRSMSGNLGDRYVMVNIPAAEIEAVESGMIASRHTGVVGKIDRPSPTLSVKIIEVNLNPFWTVPASIIRKDLIPKMQADPQYLTKNNIRIYDQRGNMLLPEQINWNSYEATNYMFRQDPGEINSMGTMRINMPNKEGVYMHDTPSKGLFGENARFHSSGCVRVQNVRELAAWLLKDTGNWSRQQLDAGIKSGERIDIKLPKPVPVHWVYISAWGSTDGSIQFRDDIYDRDGIGQLAMR